jgi:hypothetical protein
MSDDRSDRLRKRRQTRDPDTDDGEDPGSVSTESPSSTEAEDSDTDEQSSVTVKEALQGIYLYGEPDQKKRVDRIYNRLKADYEYEYDDTLGKNEHFYRVLLEVGLEGLENMDVLELRRRLEDLESLENLHDNSM